MSSLDGRLVRPAIAVKLIIFRGGDPFSECRKPHAETKNIQSKTSVRKESDPNYLNRLAHSVHYGGNPEHKINPGDFGLTPPSLPQADKTKCDIVKVFLRKEAIGLLKEGVRKGLISERVRNDYPQNIWVVTEEGWPLEAQLENVQKGVYHGYPMAETDPFREEVMAQWNKQ